MHHVKEDPVQQRLSCFIWFSDKFREWLFAIVVKRRLQRDDADCLVSWDGMAGHPAKWWWALRNRAAVRSTLKIQQATTRHYFLCHKSTYQIYRCFTLFQPKQLVWDYHAMKNKSLHFGGVLISRMLQGFWLSEIYSSLSSFLCILVAEINIEIIL